jgi:signal transduction histidine kinase
LSQRLNQGLSQRLSGLSVEVLLWAMGLFCAFVGAFLLVSPHHFQSGPYEALLPYALAWGTLSLVAGLGLLAVTVMGPPRWVSCAVHALVGLTLLALAASFARVNAVSGALVYTIFGAGILFACRLSRDRPATAGGDLFALLMGLAAVGSGVLILGFPESLRPAFYGPYRHHLPVFGVAFLLAGLLLVHAQLRPALPRVRGWIIHLLAGTAFFLFGLFVSLPGGIWTGVALYCAGGLIVAFLPWGRPWLTSLDTSSLQARLSLTLAISTSLALILATAVATAQEERLAEEAVRATEKIEARSVAQNVFDYMERKGARGGAIDIQALQRRITRQGSSVSLADGDGRTIASADGLLPSEGLPPLPAGWDRRIRAGGTVEREGVVAEFARVPRLGWIVAVERPRADALAGVRRGRDFAFGLLLLVIPLAVVAGIYASRHIARPLGELSNAVGEMTAGNLAAPLGASSGISEVARLSAAFQEMRHRLAERTVESERLATELRARAEALAETDRRKDEFLAMLAHELRNPLGAIGNASYLLEQLGSTDARTARPVAIIRRQIQHLVRMVDDLLDVSRITRGKVELRRERLDLAEVLRHVVETARPLAEAREQTLRSDIPAAPLPLDGDATRLEQVFSNLLRNAVKFTDAGGTIEVAARRDGTGEAVVRVRDDGLGIPADLLPRVFDLFAQGEQGLDRSEAGLGIGLTLVRSLVEMHGGRVKARSEGPGRGSELEVRLPLAAGL